MICKASLPTFEANFLLSNEGYKYYCSSDLNPYSECSRKRKKYKFNMRVSWAKLLALSCLYEASQGNPVPSEAGYQLQPFNIDLSSRVPRMIDQIKGTELPAHPVYINTGTSAGISLSLLESFRAEWLNSFDWKREQQDLNKCVFTSSQ
jgi:hypothetical protein